MELVYRLSELTDLHIDLKQLRTFIDSYILNGLDTPSEKRTWKRRIFNAFLLISEYLPHQAGRFAFQLGSVPIWLKSEKTSFRFWFRVRFRLVVPHDFTFDLDAEWKIMVYSEYFFHYIARIFLSTALCASDIYSFCDHVHVLWSTETWICIECEHVQVRNQNLVIHEWIVRGVIYSFMGHWVLIMKYSIQMVPVLNHNLVIGPKPPVGRHCYIMLPLSNNSFQLEWLII